MHGGFCVEDKYARCQSWCSSTYESRLSRALAVEKYQHSIGIFSIMLQKVADVRLNVSGLTLSGPKSSNGQASCDAARSTVMRLALILVVRLAVIWQTGQLNTQTIPKIWAMTQPFKHKISIQQFCFATPRQSNLLSSFQHPGCTSHHKYLVYIQHACRVQSCHHLPAAVACST